MAESTGSLVRRWWMACFMMKHGCGALRPPYCTGMRILTLAVLTAGSALLAQDLPSIKVDVHRVVGAEVVDGLLHDETRTRRGASTLLYRDANTYTCRAYCGQRTASVSIRIPVQ